MYYLVVSCNPWDCENIYKKIFDNEYSLYKYLAEYKLDTEKQEELTVHKVDGV